MADSGSRGPVSFRALHAAYIACRRGKRKARNTMAYEARCLDRLIETRDALNAETWRPSRTIAFVVDQPKAREIHAADFADRVVHHWLVPRLEAWFEPVFVHDSYSNRKGKGTHVAVDRLHDFLQQATKSGKRQAYYLQLDIANFFNSIDRETLYGLLRRRAEKRWHAEKATTTERSAGPPEGGLTPPRGEGAQRQGSPDTSLLPGRHAEINFCLWLCRTMLDHDASAMAIERGPARSFARVPAHKRLKNAPAGIGLPIGNLTSQFFANVYLDRLDQFVKHELKCRHYLRYVDDFVLVHEDPAQLLVWRAAIEAFLAEQLGLRLKALSAPLPVGGGIDFLGYVVRRTYRLPRARVLRQAHARLGNLAVRIVRREGNSWTVRWPPVLREHLRATWASTLGHLAHAASRRQAQALWQRHPWARSAFAFDATNLRLHNRFEPDWVASYAGQKRWFARRFSRCVVLVQKGCEYEVDAAALPASSRIGIAPRIPAVRLPRLLSALRRAGRPYVVAAEDGYLKHGLKRRVLHEVGWPATSARSRFAPTPASGARHAS